MKKNLFILAAAALALASCSSDETVESVALSKSNEINFRPLVASNTRATDITATTLQSFGFKVFSTVGNEFSTIYFNETQFTYAGGTYTSSTKYYWPSSGTLDFYAYSYNGAENQVSHTAQTKAFTVTPAATAADQTDLVFANTNGKSKDGVYSSSTYGAAGVPLNFRHAESKVTVQLKNSSTALKVTVKDVTIGYLNTTGTYTYSGSTTNGNTDNSGEYLKFGDWTAKSGTGSYTQTATTTEYISTTPAAALPTSFILIPQSLTIATAYSSAEASAAFNGAYITVQLKIQNAANNAYIVGTAEANGYVTAMWPLPAGTWNPGHHYTYTVDLAGGGYYPTNQTSTDEKLDPILGGAEIKFVNVTVDDWTDETEIPVSGGGI